jgi:hypothetical protein
MLTAILLSAAASSLLAPGAQAQTANQTTINQVQLGDIFSQQTLTVTEAPSGTSAGTIALGNSATAVGSGSAMAYQATQELGAEVGGKTNISVAGSSGSGLYETTSATGNTGTAGTCCAATTGSVVQTVDAYHGVTAESYAYTGGPTATVSVDSAAVGNTQGWEAVNGSVNTTTSQTHYGTTDAETSAQIAAAGEASYSATAVANNVTTDATNSSVNQSVSQDTDGYFTVANVAVTQGGGNDVSAAATATANNINVTSDSNPAALAADQLSTKPVTASSSVNIDNWSGGATSSAYGVANSAIVSNAGPMTTVSAQQNAIGPVTVTASLTGGAGGDGFASATGVGNAVSGYACSSCNGVVRGSATQTSSGGVSTTATVTGGNVNSATGISTAIGNTATFVVQKPGG